MGVKYSGIKGKVIVASGTGNWGGDGTADGIVAANVSKWSASIAANPKDVTTFASAGWMESINANKELTGTLEMFNDSVVVLAIATGSNPTLTLVAFDGAATDKTLSFSAVLESLDTGADGASGNPVTTSYKFKSTGVVTIA